MGVDRLLRNGLKSGDLSLLPLVEVIGYCYAREKTGQLSLSKGKVERHIYFYSGLPVYASSTAPADTLPEMMVKLGKLERENLPRLRELTDKENLTEEQALLNLGVIVSSQYYYLQVALAREIIISSCGYREGHFLFNEIDRLLDEIPLYDLNPLEIIYEAITRYHEMGLAEKIQTLENRTISLNPRTKEFLPLPEDYYIYTDMLDEFSAAMTVGEAIARLYQEFSDIAKALRFLYILIVTGTLVLEDVEPAPAVISFRPLEPGPEERKEPEKTVQDEVVDQSTSYVVVKSRKKKAAPAPVPRQETKREPLETAPEKLPEIPATKTPAPRQETTEPKASAPPPEASAPKPDKKKSAQPLDQDFLRRMEILEQKFKKADTLYEFLGVKVSAGLPEIQKAYSRISGHYQLDRVVQDEGIQARLVSLKDHLNEAVQTLTNPEKRTEYERKLFLEERKRSWNIPLKKEIAKKEFERGVWYLENNRPEIALSRFEHANELVPEVPDYFAYIGWAMYRARKGNMDEITGYLRHALEADSNCDLAYYFLGVIAKREGDEERAEKLFRKAVDLNPKNSRAARELSFIEKHKKQKGFFSQLFSK
jgi:tetratricopeptide (TPR) repeat protein